MSELNLNKDSGVPLKCRYIVEEQGRRLSNGACQKSLATKFNLSIGLIKCSKHDPTLVKQISQFKIIKMNSPLSKLKVGNRGKIAYFIDDAIAGKLTTMGILPGSIVNVIRKAPFKGGIYLKIDGGNIVLRDREAAAIILSV